MSRELDSRLISLEALAWFKDGNLPDLFERIRERLHWVTGAVEAISDLKPLPGGTIPAAVE